MQSMGVPAPGTLLVNTTRRHSGWRAKVTGISTGGKILMQPVDRTHGKNHGMLLMRITLDQLRAQWREL